MWQLEHKESWVPKNWCFWTVVLEKTLESPLDCKEIQPVHHKGDQSGVFIGRTDDETETPGWQYIALMYSFFYLEPVCCSMSSSNCFLLTYIQISQEADQAVWYSHLFQNFPQFTVIHTVKGFGIVYKTGVDVFLKLSCFFDDPMDVGNLISGSYAFSKTSLNIWKFTVHIPEAWIGEFWALI